MIKKVILIILLVGLFVYVGACAYGNIFTGNKIPDRTKAAYGLQIVNTGAVVLTNDYDTYGTKVGFRTYILHGYWEPQGQGYKYIKADITLQEQIIGEIILKKRVVK